MVERLAVLVFDQQVQATCWRTGPIGKWLCLLNSRPFAIWFKR